MTLTTTTRARSTTSTAPRVSLRRGLFLNESRHERLTTPKPTWIGSLVVQR